MFHVTGNFFMMMFQNMTLVLNFQLSPFYFRFIVVNLHLGYGKEARRRMKFYTKVMEELLNEKKEKRILNKDE